MGDVLGGAYKVMKFMTSPFRLSIRCLSGGLIIYSGKRHGMIV
jgi:hypothetical protein